MLHIKDSQLPDTGFGLFTEEPLERGDVIIEYWGDEISWEECQKRNQDQEGYGNYYLYINDDFCVDAQHHPQSYARYANDAEGITRVKGYSNNAQFEIIDGKPFLVATKDIAQGEEIFVEYGEDYWEVVRERLLEESE